MFLLQPQKVKVLGLHLAEGLVLGPVVFLTLARAVRDQETAWVAEQISGYSEHIKSLYNTNMTGESWTRHGST